MSKTDERPSHAEVIIPLAPVGTVGYQIEVHYADRVRLYPPALRESGETPPRDWFQLQPFELPRGIPEGDHRIIFISAQRNVLLIENFKYYFRSPAKAKAADPDEVEESEEEGEDQDESLRRQFGYQRLEKNQHKLTGKLTHYKAEAELVFLLQQSQRESMAVLAEVRRSMAEEAKTQLEASRFVAATISEVARLMKETAEATKLPPPPVLPPDWVGFATTLVEGARDVVKTAILAGRPDKADVIEAGDRSAALPSKGGPKNDPPPSATKGGPTERPSSKPETAQPAPPKASSKPAPPEPPTPPVPAQAEAKQASAPVTETALVTQDKPASGEARRDTATAVVVWTPKLAWRTVKRQIAGLSDFSIAVLLSSRQMLVRFVQHLARLCRPPTTEWSGA